MMEIEFLKFKDWFKTRVMVWWFLVQLSTLFYKPNEIIKKNPL